MKYRIKNHDNITIAVGKGASHAVAHFGYETASSQEPYLQVACRGDYASVGGSTGVLMQQMGPTLLIAEAFQALGELEGTGGHVLLRAWTRPLDMLVVVAQGVRVECST